MPTPAGRSSPAPSSSRRLGAVALLVLALGVSSGCASDPASPPDALPGAETVSLGPVGPTTTAKPSRDRSDAAPTHLGRTVLDRSGLVVRARITRVSPPLHGAVVARAEVAEPLRGATEEGDELTVLAGDAGIVPDPGRECVLFVDPIPLSDNVRLVQAVPLWDDEGPARLAALRDYLAVEALAQEDREAAFDLLLTGLRARVTGADEWLRWNAAEEYVSLARAHPGRLGPDDARALGAALSRTRSAPLRRRLTQALDGIPDASPTASAVIPRTPRDDEPVVEVDDTVVTLWVERYEAAADGAERRQVVVDGVAELGPASGPLVRRALDDADPVVRDTGVVAAARLDSRELGPRLVELLVAEEHPRVRESAVRAAGLLRLEGAVPTLAVLARAGDEGLREAWFALARIRTDDALAALRDVRATRTGDERATLDFLLSDAFLEQERALDRRP